MSKCLWTVIIACTVTACVVGKTSMTRDEFSARMSQNPGYIDTFIVDRQFAKVVKTMKQKTDECLNTRSTWSRTSGGMMTSRVTMNYNATFQVISADRAELTIQEVPSGMMRIGPKMPPGGFYRVAVDFEKMGSKTKLSFYGSAKSWNKTFSAVKEWSAGRTGKCINR